MGDLIASAVLIAAVVLIIKGMIKDRKAGKHSCGCDCGSCAASCMCHAKLPEAGELNCKKD